MPTIAPSLHSPEGQAMVGQQSPAVHGVAGSMEQIYVTDRLYGEGRQTQRSFDIHSSSTDDGFLLRFALEYPHDNGAGGPAQGGRRRLALVRIPGGKSALIHTVFSPPAKLQRANNLFSQVLVHPALRARQALATWASPGWALSAPAEAGTHLAPVAELPPAGPISDQAITRFLQGAGPKENGESSIPALGHGVQSMAERLPTAQRRELLRLVLRGCQLALQANPMAQRQRLYLLAEPDLSALLLYAAARLLPEALAARLTFSTWEHPHCLRGYKHARVVSTLTADVAAGLDEYFFTTSGYALDTFNWQFSPELDQGDRSEIEDWIDLAANGQWTEVERIYDLLGEGDSIDSFHEARQAYRLSARLDAGKAEAEDLLAAKTNGWGLALLDRHRAQVWPLVRDASLLDPLVRETFADWLAEHLPELELRAAAALRRGAASYWKPQWQLLRVALKEDPERLRQTLLRILPDPPYHPELRLGLLEELTSLQLRRAQAPARFQALLMHCTAEDLELLAHSQLDREWFIWALLHALVSSGTASAAVAHLHGGDDALIRTFWEQFQLLRKEDQRRAILAPLFFYGSNEVESPPGEGARFLSRALKQHCQLPAETLTWLLDSLGAWHEDWQSFWMADNHLSLLFEAIQAACPSPLTPSPTAGEMGRDEGREALWERLCSQIGGDLLVAGNAYQQALVMELGAAQSRAPLPDKAAAALADWILLRQHFEKASSVPLSARQELLDACNRRGLDAIGLLARYFEKFVLPKALETEVVDDFAGFFHSFFAGGEEYDDYSRRLICWLRVVDACPEEVLKGLYQGYYLQQHVPDEFRWRLAQETYQRGKLLTSAHESVWKPTEAPEPLDARTLDAAGLFQLTGVAQAGGGIVPPGVGKRFVALLPAVTAGVVAVLVSGWFKDPLRNNILIAFFLPALYALAEAVALQSAGLSLLGLGGHPRGWREVGKLVLGEIRPGLFLGAVCGLIAAVLALLRGARFELILGLGGAFVASLASAALLGLAVPIGIRRLRLETRLPPGTTARAAAGIAALLIYFFMTCRLLA